MTPSGVERVLNLTGRQIYDSGSDMNYSRIDIYQAIIALDKTAPAILFSNESPENNSYHSVNYTLINITSTENLIDAWLNINNTNNTMFGNGTSWYLNYSVRHGHNYTYTVHGNDTSGNTGVSARRVLNMVANALPVVNVSILSSDGGNRTNGTLSVSTTTTDANNDDVTLEFRWYNNTVMMPSLENQTTVPSANTTKYENWTVSTRGFDSWNYSNWANATITINNALPYIEYIENITINETDGLNISVSASDQDNDSFNLSIDNGNFTLNGTSFIWNTTINDSGTYVFNITANESDTDGPVS
jgi:hypothetical protein